ncbi:GNAT family N-acetyltransferase [Paenibacillus sp. 19GGS1-52]|uniref:GNAT family N-acetyltransferase n=1 Tax=Paenibacillus sp. 19GGS1-52 TaxID=2758563 RepID=UPI001EFC1328|nr:GNAT family N-acetyltransferase [Paenibacillus sp. 19GGS1-52]ULO09554.1 GNAT family N-acetyltransferase [Paenibacillus sp. 19GGS1-52]
MNIRVLQETDAPRYQELRLNSLIINPEAFGSTYEREVGFSLETVVERIKPSKDKFVLGAFDSNGSLVGIVTFMRENSQETVHKGNVYGMYVAPEVRGQGLGKSLMLELLTKARDCEGLEQINLTVVSNNDSAKKLYKSVGFEVYSMEGNVLNLRCNIN